MFFASDNGGPVHPKIMQALARANDAYAMPYGDEALAGIVRDQVREVFEAPRAEVFLVVGGTAANVLILGTLARPFETIHCTDTAHVYGHECNAPEFYTGGAKLAAVASIDGKMQPDALRAALAPGMSVHDGTPGPLSLTNLTETGTVYSPAELAELAGIAHAQGLSVHLDGARLANALVATGATPAEMTWKAGVDALSLGATKNGAMGVEAVVFFDPEKAPAQARDFGFRRMRGGHLMSKHRYLSAQMQAYLQDGLWLELAQQANAANRAMAEGLAATGLARVLHDPAGNITFAQWPRALHRRLAEAGAIYYLMDGDAEQGPPGEMLTARLVCGWSTRAEDVAAFLGHFRGAD